MNKARPDSPAPRDNFPIWASLLTFISFCILCSLGTWQIQRLAWKTELLQSLQTAYATIDSQPLSRLEDIVHKTKYQPIRIRGRFAQDQEIKLHPRTYEGRIGYHQYIPFHIEGGGTILVNRGWIPDTGSVTAVPTTTVTLKAVLHSPQRANLFVPANDPAGDLWYSISLPAIANHYDLTLLESFMLFSLGEKPAHNTPETKALHQALPNNHLGYAFFWFSMALTLLIVFYFRFIRKVSL